jgi:hypothetical protein
LFFALVATAGSLWLTLGLELIPCPLCFFQRVFVLALTAVLLVGLFAGAPRSGYLSLVTLPLTVAALGIAGIQVYLEYTGGLECPEGAIPAAYRTFREEDDIYKQIEDVITPPRESLAVLVLLFLTQVIDLIRSRTRGGYGWGALLAALIVGALLATGTYMSRGTKPINPAKDTTLKKGELNGCRPPAEK